MDDRPDPGELDAARRRYAGAVERGRRLRRRRRLGIGSSVALVVAVGLAVAVPLLSRSSPSQERVVVASPSGTATTAPRLGGIAPPGTAAAPTSSGPSQAPTTPATAPPTTAAPPTSAAPAATETVAVPTVGCTTENASNRPSIPVPATESLQLPAALVGTVALYYDARGNQVVLAPKGWECSALDAGDGSSGLTVAPGSEGQNVPGHAAAGSAVEAVSASQTAGCAGCTVSTACPLFPAAAAAFQSQFSRPCPTAAPAAEEVTRISAGLVAFEDPPGVAGTGASSGGRYAANGVLTYYPSSDQGSWSETCTLPAAQHQLCTASLNAFIAAYGSN